MIRNISMSEFRSGFDDRFNVETNDWIERSDKWVIKAIRQINTSILYNPVVLNLPFTDGMLIMPIDMEILNGITYEGVRLIPSDYDRIPQESTYSGNTYYFLGASKTGNDIIVDREATPIEMQLPTIKDTKTVTSVTDYTYSYIIMRDNIIKINVPETNGYVNVFFKSLPYKLDKGKLEMLIPQDEYLVEALEWYVLTRLIGRGYKHHTFDYKYANERWDKFRKEARRSVNQMSEDDRELASRHFRHFLTDYEHWYRLNTYGI